MSRPAIVVLLLAGCAAPPKPDLSPSEPIDVEALEIARLIDRLGAEEVEERESAQAALLQIGERAEPALTDALGSTDGEIAGRANSILGQIELRRLPERVKSLPTLFARKKFERFSDARKHCQGLLETTEENGSLVLSDTSYCSVLQNGSSSRQVCTMDAYLTARTMEWQATGMAGEWSRKAEIKDRHFEGVKDQKTVVLSVSEKAVTGGALIRLVGLLPQRKGFVFEFDLLDDYYLTVVPGYRLTCQGEGETDIAGKAVKAWRWLFACGRNEPADWWVKDGAILKTSSPGSETIYSDP